MRKISLLLFVLILFTVLYSKGENCDNPFFHPFKTPFGAPDFTKIKTEHYMPAFKRGIAEHLKEIDAIVNNKAKPTFKNTIEALDRSGELLRKVSSIFFNLLAADTNDTMQKIAQEITPLLSKHEDDILLNAKLFERIKDVYKQKDKLKLNTEQKTVLEKYYKDFERGGANLCEKKKEQLREINKKISLLTLKFGENLLKGDNKWKMILDKKSDLKGLPDDIIEGAAKAAEKAGLKGKWLFTLHKPSWIPFLQYSERRDLREKIYKAWMNRGDNNDEFDNKKIVDEIVNLRLKKARLFGFKNHASYVLDTNMAKTPDKVYDLLYKVWKPALRRAKDEAAEYQKMIYKEGEKFKLMPWDWFYYAEKLRKERYALDDNMLKPYFELENVRKGLFTVVNRLYGIKFIERKDIPVYHKDVKVFELKDTDGTTIGIIYMDNYQRASKRGGAWMDAFRKEAKIDGKRIVPIVYNVTNFPPKIHGKPVLLNIDQVRTMFHEFGHALHGLLSQCTYYRVSGTEVSRDFVELPSQIMENWAIEPSVMKMYAKHYKTGKPIPDELIRKIKNSGFFNQGFATVEYLAASFLDMDWHTIDKNNKYDVDKFEKSAMDKIGLISEIIPRYRSTYFAHIFAGGYSAGYYSYIWAEVLDADAFALFKKRGIFDRKTATDFRNYILAKGGSDDPMVLYEKFRGEEPSIKPLLERRGLLKENK
jgi:peptidyl-dipeptidase Dcp